MSTCVYCHSPVNWGAVFCCQSCELLYNWVNNKQNPISEKLDHKWAHYDHDSIESQFNTSEDAAFKKFKFHIEGLQCSSCVHLLEDLPAFESRVSKAKLNYTKAVFEVEVKNEVKLGQLCSIIASLGYVPSPLKEISDYEKAVKAENTSELKKIGVAAAVAANQMLFAIPLYAGLTNELATVFKWISFFLFLPLLFYSATPFYKRAFASLVVRRINVDSMIVVALWGGFTLSTFSLLTGRDDLYFDSTASFIFLILSTRYLLRYHQNKFIKKDLFVDMFKDQVYEISRGERVLYKAFSEVETGDVVKLHKNQFLGFDSQLNSAQTFVDISFLTGESYPQLFRKGEVIRAGSRILDEGIEAVCTLAPEKTVLAKSLANLELLVNDKNKYQTLTDVVSHRLTLAVFSIAALYFAFTFSELGYEAFKRSLALITIACPCAVAFGTPLAHHLGVRKAIRDGFLIKNENVFEKLSTIKKILFDKTGTLTSSDLQLMQTFPPQINAEFKKIILGLEKNSMHPVAVSLKKAWEGTEYAEVINVTEEIGFGVSGEFEGRRYRIAKNQDEQNPGMMQVDFYCDGKAEAYLYFEETPLPEARGVVDQLQKLDFDIMMLSGDKRTRVLEVSRKLAIRPANAFSEQTSETKAQIVSEKNPCMFVGDGLNDLAALKSAEVSFAVRGPFEATMQVSDIYAPQKSLSAILQILDLSKRVQSTVQGNLFFAILYNTIGGVLALLGFINPLVAAILMPISSLLITLHTVWRLK